MIKRYTCWSTPTASSAEYIISTQPSFEANTNRVTRAWKRHKKAYRSGTKHVSRSTDACIDARCEHMSRLPRLYHGLYRTRLRFLWHWCAKRASAVNVDSCFASRIQFERRRTSIAVMPDFKFWHMKEPISVRLYMWLNWQVRLCKYADQRNDFVKDTLIVSSESSSN